MQFLAGEFFSRAVSNQGKLIHMQSTTDSTFWASLPISLWFIYHWQKIKKTKPELQEAKLDGHKWEKEKC